MSTSTARTAAAASPLLSIAEACAVYGVHRHTIRRWIAAGILPAVKVGPRLYRIRADDLSRIGEPVLPPAVTRGGAR